MEALLTVAAVQMTSTDDVGRNLDEACSVVRAAAAVGARLIVLPENFGFGHGEREKLAHAQDVETAPFLAPLRHLARELEIGILAGSIPEVGPDPEHVYNTSVLIGRNGETLASYRKIHLFDVDLGELQLRESTHVAAGSRPAIGNFDGWAIGLSVCYDLRFPELYRRLSYAGARILVVPSAFTLHTGKDHWEVLLRARAIENQCFVVAADQFGASGPGKLSWGKSMIIDPWGTTLAVAPERPGFILATLDATEQDRVRRELPALTNRMPPGFL